MGSVVTAVVAVLAVGVGIAVLASIYRVARADEAFVRTGLGGPVAVVDRGAFVLPLIHRRVPVSLRTVGVEVRLGGEGGGAEAVAGCAIEARVHTRVGANEADVLQASRQFSGRPVTAETVGSFVTDQLRGALEAAAGCRDAGAVAGDWDGIAQTAGAQLCEALAARGMTVELLTMTCRVQVGSAEAVAPGQSSGGA